MKKPWSRSTKIFFVLFYFAAFVLLLYATRPLLTPLLIASLLAYLLNPLVRWLIRRFALKRSTAAAITYGLFLAIVVAIPSSFTTIAARQINRLTDDVDSILAAIETFVEEPVRIRSLTLDPPRETIITLDQEIRSFVSQGSSRAIESLSNLGTNLVWLIIIFVTTFYLLRDGPGLRSWLLDKIPPDYQEDVRRLLKEIDGVWGMYLRGQVILAAMIGVLTGVSMALVGLRGALVIGVIAGVLDLIPSLGPIVGGAISIVTALVLGSNNLAVSNFWFALIVGGIFFLLQQFENIWLAPKILGGRLKLHPALVVVGVMGALALTGILGAFIVIPLIASVFIVNRYVYARLFDRDPWETEPVTAEPEAHNPTDEDDEPETV